MKLKISKKVVLGLVFTIILGILSIGIFWFTDRPTIGEKLVKIECQWYDAAIHTAGPTNTTIDQTSITRIVGLMAEGRRTLSIGKVRYKAEIKLVDATGREDCWILMADNTISNWGGSRSYRVGADLERVLKANLTVSSGPALPEKGE
jgi:hypothetical protein